MQDISNDTTHTTIYANAHHVLVIKSGAPYAFVMEYCYHQTSVSLLQYLFGAEKHIIKKKKSFIMPLFVCVCFDLCPSVLYRVYVDPFCIHYLAYIMYWVYLRSASSNIERRWCYQLLLLIHQRIYFKSRQWTIFTTVKSICVLNTCGSSHVYYCNCNVKMMIAALDKMSVCTLRVNTRIENSGHDIMLLYCFFETKQKLYVYVVGQ